MKSCLALTCVLFLGCAAPSPDVARRGTIVTTLVHADELQLRARPALTAGKYRRMAASPFDFYRGSFFLFLRDSRDSTQAVGTQPLTTDVQPYGLGDAHLENFGLLRGPSEQLSLEPNDFDAADRWPFEIDLRRLTVSLLLGARVAKEPVDETAEREMARAVLSSYVARIRACAARQEPEPEAPDSESPHLLDLQKRARRDGAAREELALLTTIEDGTRRFRRGGVDPDDPDSVLADLPARALQTLPETLTTYPRTLAAAPAPEFFTLLDAVREFGSGVASWPRVRVLALVRGPSDEPSDDVVLEVKEALDSGARETVLPGRFFDDLSDRICTIRDAAWSQPAADPLWGMGTWLGLRVQVRSETEWHKNLRTSRFEDERATPAAYVDLATRLGRRVGNLHSARVASVEPCVAIARTLGDGDAFVEHEIDVAREYASRVLEDYALFRSALDALGPLLGYPVSALEPPSRELGALFGDPPEGSQP